MSAHTLVEPSRRRDRRSSLPDLVGERGLDTRAELSA
jgi:hypothetical protein